MNDRAGKDVGSKPHKFQMAGEEISALDYYKIIRSQIEHEDNLVSARLNWFITSQSFLFTALAITSNAPTLAKIPRFDHVQQLLSVVIPFVAIGVTVLVYIAMFAGVIAMHRLRDALHQKVGHSHELGLPPVQGYTRTQVMGLCAPLGIPLIFGGVWIFLLFYTAS